MAVDRTRQPASATIAEIAPCIDVERWLLHDVLADLTAVGLIERITIGKIDNGEPQQTSYRISGSGRHIVLTDHNTQRRSRYDH
jgi:hypothetical protein